MGAGDHVNREELERDLRERAFRSPDDDPRPSRARPWAVGLEVELFPVRTVCGRRVRVEEDGKRPGSRELLERAAARPGWALNGHGDGVPAVTTPGGARLSFEPGGQLEYSSPSLDSLDRLLGLLRHELEAVREIFSRAHVTLLAQGMDPSPQAPELPLQLDTPRYRRMARSFRSYEPAGRRMMRHTASIHVNLDWTDDPVEEWDVANRLSPVFAALFANSPVFGGRRAGFRSYRTVQWTHLDPRRSGPVRGEGEDPVLEYLDFALEAPAFLLGSEEPPYAPFAHWLGNGAVSRGDWERHLSTLFPEVRPRGYLEFRSVDALPLEWAGVPALLLRGLLQHPPTRRTVRDLLPPASRSGLEAAARWGVRDSERRRVAHRVIRLGVEGARELALPEQDGVLRSTEAFAEAFVGRGRDPGDVGPERPGVA